MLRFLTLFTGVYNEGFDEVVPKGAAGNQAQCGVFYDDERGRIRRLTQAEGHDISFNPETKELNLIGQEAPEEFIKSYRISFGKDIVIEKGEPNYEFFARYKRMRPTGNNAKLRIYISDFRLEEVGATHNKYYCEAFDVTCTVDSANETDSKLTVNFSQAGSLEYGIIERTDDGGEITYGFMTSKDIDITKINVTDKADTDGVEVGIGKTKTIAVEFSPLGSEQEFTVISEDDEFVMVEKLRNSVIIKGIKSTVSAPVIVKIISTTATEDTAVSGKTIAEIKVTVQ
jgi:hypothetical protein